jgi:hypothetical protein
MVLENLLPSLEVLQFYLYQGVFTTLILLLGWIAGKLSGEVVKKFLKKFNADRYFRFGRGILLSKTVPVIVSWIIYLWAMRVAVAFLGIPELTQFFDQILTFLPKILGGSIVILLGYLMAKYIEGHVLATKSEYSTLVGQIIFLFIMIIAIDLAFNLVELNTRLIEGIILILVGSVGIGIAIALGLGLKETVAKLAKKYTKKL